MNFILDLLFPRRCVSCGRVGRYFCSKCQEKIKPIEFQVCPVCERPAINGTIHPKCRSRYSLNGLTSFFEYDGPIKKAIKELKYRFVTDLAEELTNLTSSITLNNFIITSVPLHWRRENWRGFNQSAVLGKLISARLGIGFAPDLLIRKKYTKPQVELKGKERQENIQEAFVLNHNSSLMIHNSNIIIFDDVWTTGSTLKACGIVLKQAGAKKVWGMTLAR